MKTVLVVGRCFPNQFKHILRRMEGKWNIVALFNGNEEGVWCNLEQIAYTDHKEDSPDANASGVMSKIIQFLNAKSIMPNVILSHVGWGYNGYLRKVFPNIPIIGFIEWYNINDWYVWSKYLEDALEQFNFCICPTMTQKKSFPQKYWGKMIKHTEGVDCDFFAPKNEYTTNIEIAQRSILSQPVELNKVSDLDEMFEHDASKKKITYITRGYESIRCFYEFLCGIKELMDSADYDYKNNVVVYVIGSTSQFYVKDPTYYDKCKVILDALPNVRQLGVRSKQDIRRIHWASDVHVYFSEIFVLSWSCLEALASGCVLLTSDNSMMREMITHEENGYIVNHNKPQDIRNMLIRILFSNEDLNKKIRRNCRRMMIEKYDSKKCGDFFVELIDSLCVD